MSKSLILEMFSKSTATTDHEREVQAQAVFVVYVLKYGSTQEAYKALVKDIKADVAFLQLAGVKDRKQLFTAGNN